MTAKYLPSCGCNLAASPTFTEHQPDCPHRTNVPADAKWFLPWDQEDAICEAMYALAKLIDPEAVTELDADDYAGIVGDYIFPNRRARHHAMVDALDEIASRTYNVQYEDGAMRVVVGFANEIHEIALAALPRCVECGATLWRRHKYDRVCRNPNCDMRVPDAS